MGIDGASQPAIQPAIRYRVRLLASLTGYAITAFVVWWQWTSNFGGLPPDLAIWDRVGDQVVQGISPYAFAAVHWTQLFFYAPPWALAFGLTSWLPPIVQAGLVLVLGVAGLRYIAGSWLRVGYFGLIPLTGAELGNGSFNLVVAASIAAAMRGDGRLAAWCSLAKVSPILAVRDYRRAALVLVVAAAVTLPAWHWWLEWIELLLWTNANFAIGYQVWFPGRVAAAVALVVLVQRPWARGLAAAIAIPALYSYSLVLLYPLIAYAAWWRRSEPERPAADDPAASVASPVTAST